MSTNSVQADYWITPNICQTDWCTPSLYSRCILVATILLLRPPRAPTASGAAFKMVSQPFVRPVQSLYHTFTPLHWFL